MRDIENLSKKINHDGFTMIELIIVIALIAIIGAMLIPSFSETVARARLKTDINDMKAIQNAVDLYEAETSTNITETDKFDVLVSKGYLKKAPVPQFKTGVQAKYSVSNIKDLGRKVIYTLPAGVDEKYKKYLISIEGLVTDDNKTIIETEISTETELKVMFR